jgi:hypothetical protein
MPYYRHARTEDADSGTEPFDTKQAAMDGHAPDETATFIASTEEIAAWHKRECVRLNDGTYQPAPALPQVTSEQLEYLKLVTTASHYLHLSAGNPGLVAYTPSDEFGVQDRQLRCKPGKYLQKFYGEAFTAQQIVEWADTVKAIGQAIHFTSTPEECVRVYRSLRGPDSCMGNPEKWNADTHPAQVYGGGDVSVAYLGHIGGEQTSNDSVTARVVVNMAAKKYSRIYGIAAGELRVLLAAEGYTAHTDALEGARILSRPRSTGGYFLPYIDGMQKVVMPSDQEGFLVVTNAYSGPCEHWMRATNLNGWANVQDAIAT